MSTIVPFPRQLHPGTVGRDVLAVKQCLHRLHHDTGMNENDPTWGGGSAGSLAEFLAAHGHPHANGHDYGPIAHGVLSPRMNPYERRLMVAVYKKLHTPKLQLTVRDQIVRCARNYYDHRNSTYYTQDARRWQGIHDQLFYPHFPTYSDCSAFATWCYWQGLHNHADTLNGENWRGGFTGTLIGHGRTVSALLPGDLVFYGHPVSHVAVYVGNGRVVSHGHDPVGIYLTRYRSDINHARSYL